MFFFEFFKIRNKLIYISRKSNIGVDSQIPCRRRNVKEQLAELFLGLCAAFGLLKVLPGGNLICLIQIAICGVVYLIAALAFGTIKKEDVLMLPSGEKIAALMLKYKLLK